MNSAKNKIIYKFLHKIKWIIYIILLFAVLINIIFFYESLLISAGEAFEMIYKTVLCIIFPYMIIAELVSGIPVHKIIPVRLGQVFEKIFGCDIKTISAFVMGNICGYPTGAKILISQYEGGVISKTTLENMLPYVTNSSAGFVIGTIGAVICKNTFLGIIIYIVQILSTVICALLSKKNKIYHCDEASRIKAKGFGKILADSTQNTVLIWGTVLSFNLFITMAVNLFSLLKADGSFLATARLLTSSVLEITNGVICASRYTDGILLCVLLCMINCFSGLSVAMQIKMILTDDCISLKPYFTKKVLQSIIGGLIMVLVVYVLI